MLLITGDHGCDPEHPARTTPESMFRFWPAAVRSRQASLWGHAKALRILRPPYRRYLAWRGSSVAAVFGRIFEMTDKKALYKEAVRAREQSYSPTRDSRWGQPCLGGPGRFIMDAILKMPPTHPPTVRSAQPFSKQYLRVSGSLRP